MGAVSDHVLREGLGICLIYELFVIFQLFIVWLFLAQIMVITVI